MSSFESGGAKPAKDLQTFKQSKPEIEPLRSEVIEDRKVWEELKRSNEFLIDVINALEDSFFVKDREHRWVMLNDAACDLIGRPREELIGKSDYDLFPKE